MKKYFTQNKLLTIFLMFLFGSLASGTLTFMISWTSIKGDTSGLSICAIVYNIFSRNAYCYASNRNNR
ncbi:hypothetical protein [Lactococcus cremoris]|uniref:hypothetical protein n=1 Tax=Lactococcus lactis subsp. cremoris TaxID=1359 RepID=UPI000301BD47|nr:hypothetical protein [Lactococcus cremoris]WKF24905.1 hypothetical protein LL158_02365 [Lactococcus cremoris]